MNRAASRLPRVLVTDDGTGGRESLGTILRTNGYQPIEVVNGSAALRALQGAPPDAAILDVETPGMSGLSILRDAQKLHSCPPIILVTSHGSIHCAVEAIRDGAFDYLTRPFTSEVLLDVLRRAVELHAWQPRSCSNDSLSAAMGTSQKIRELTSAVELVAPTDFTVIIRGETGTGKELIAKAIHKRSSRSAGPFVPIDCGSIPPSLFESELFGHEKGAFTSADRARPGKFEEASGGTLFFDEIQNLPMQVQTKVLRALQERQIYRVGSSRPVNYDARILAASNEDLLLLVKQGRFRSDLYHRLNEFNITIPALRERREDLIYLAHRFINHTCDELKKKTCALSEAAQEVLLAQHWPGNVRELRNVIRRAVLLAGSAILPHHLQIDADQDCEPAPTLMPDAALSGQLPLRELVRQCTVQREREILTHVLRQTGGNLAKASRLLQVDYKTVRSKTKLYGIHITRGGVEGHGKE